MNHYYNRFMALCHSLTHTYPNHQSSFISFLHLLRSIASFLFNLHTWQSFCTTSLRVLFCLPLGLAPSTSYSLQFFTQSLSSFRNASHTSATYFAVVPRLRHLILVSLSTVFFELRTLSFTLMSHMYIMNLLIKCYFLSHLFTVTFLLPKQSNIKEYEWKYMSMIDQLLKCCCSSQCCIWLASRNFCCWCSHNHSSRYFLYK